MVDRIPKQMIFQALAFDRVHRVLEVEHLQAVQISGDEHVGPADLVIVDEVAPVGGEGGDG